MKMHRLLYIFESHASARFSQLPRGIDTRPIGQIGDFAAAIHLRDKCTRYGCILLFHVPAKMPYYHTCLCNQIVIVFREIRKMIWQANDLREIAEDKVC